MLPFCGPWWLGETEEAKKQLEMLAIVKARREVWASFIMTQL